MPKDTWDPPSADRMLARLLARDAKERRRLSYEVACAGEVQTALLSRELPQVEGYEFFGSDRIADVVTRHRRSRLSTIATRLDCTIAEFCAGSGLTDDRSVLLVRRNE